jgi:hypothetical protein
MQKLSLIGAALALAVAVPAHAENCSELARAGLNWSALKAAVSGVVNVTFVDSSGLTVPPSGGLGFPMWLTLVDGSGKVCAVTNSLDGGRTPTADIWLGSRVISAQKANTANSFSIGASAALAGSDTLFKGGLSLSTANLYSAVQPGGSLFGLQESNPVDAGTAYDGNAALFGTAVDPLVGGRVGGINVFGGGLTLFINGHKAGAIGVSGDTSCTDHVVAWKVRSAIIAASGGKFTGPPSADPFDKMIQDIPVDPLTGKITGPSLSGFGHPTCLNNPTAQVDGGSIFR